VHKGQVQAVLGPSLQFGHSSLVLAPSLLPDLGASTDILGHLGKGSYAQRLGVGHVDLSGDGFAGVVSLTEGELGRKGSEQGLDSVGKVGKSEELTVGESVEDGRLVDTVERTRLNFTNAVETKPSQY
jgi:hypothetical protein